MSAHDPIERAIALLRASRNAVALTGAGISTPSGIPDFRTPGNGAWEDTDPLEVASITAFRRRPELFYRWIHPLAALALNAQPNPAHYALADLERHGPLRGIVTQNIDLLHSRAGSQTVYEVHDHLREVHCLRCQRVDSAESYLRQFVTTRALPLCPTCGAVLKPRIVLYGEMLPLNVLRRAERAVSECDLLIVAGSSLEVMPAAGLPALARRYGARLIIINYGPTHMDDDADVIIRADVADALPQLAAPFRQPA